LLLRKLSQLHAGATTRPRHAIEEWLGGLSLNDCVRYRVRVFLVTVSSLSYPILELYAGTLLDHVGSLVRRCVKVGAVLESYAVSACVGLGTDGLSRFPCLTTYVSFY